MTHYFTRGEIAIWTVSVVFIVMSFLAFDRESYINLAASLIGVTALIFNAKGNPTFVFVSVTLQTIINFYTLFAFIYVNSTA